MLQKAQQKQMLLVVQKLKLKHVKVQRACHNASNKEYKY